MSGIIKIKNIKNIRGYLVTKNIELDLLKHLFCICFVLKSNNIKSDDP